MTGITLMDHQVDAGAFLTGTGGVGALLHDPGTGKTFSTLNYLDALAREYDELRVLVLAPLAAVDTWILQGEAFLETPNVKLRLVRRGTVETQLKDLAASRTWESVPDQSVQFTRDPGLGGPRITLCSLGLSALSSYAGDAKKRRKMMAAVAKYDPHVVVVDEMHMLKSATSNVSKAAAAIGRLAPHRVGLTGTVTPHSPLDLYGQIRFVAPWVFSDNPDDRESPIWSWTRFLARYAIKGGFEGRQIVGYRNVEDLWRRIEPVSHVVRKEDVLDLPPVIDMEERVILSPAEAKAYDEMKRELATQLDDGTLLAAANPLVKMMRLRQITAGYIKDSDTGETHRLGDSKQRLAQSLIDTTLESQNRIVVFCYFRSEVEDLAARLRKSRKDRTVLVVNGSTKVKDRLAARRYFADVSGNTEQVVLVAQIRTMSLSVNELVVAQHGVFLSISERRDEWVQARDRLHRKGQEGEHIMFWNIFVPGSVDEVMMKAHQDRADVERAMLEHLRDARRLRR